MCGYVCVCVSVVVLAEPIKVDMVEVSACGCVWVGAYVRVGMYVCVCVVVLAELVKLDMVEVIARVCGYVCVGVVVLAELIKVDMVEVMRVGVVWFESPCSGPTAR